MGARTERPVLPRILLPSTCYADLADLLVTNFVVKKSGYEVTAMPFSMFCLNGFFSSQSFQLQDSTVLP